MGNPIDVTISLVKGVPTPSIDPVEVPKGSGATNIHWTTADDEDGIDFFRIVFKDAAQAQCSPPTPSVASRRQKTTTTDRNSEAGDIFYTIDVFLAGGGTASNDPRIHNGGD